MPTRMNFHRLVYFESCHTDSSGLLVKFVTKRNVLSKEKALRYAAMIRDQYLQIVRTLATRNWHLCSQTKD